MASWTGVSYKYGGSGLTDDRVRAILAYSSLTENDKVTYHFVVGGHGYGAYSTSTALSTSLSCSGQTTYTTSGQGGNFSNGTNVWLNPTSGNREYSWYRTTSAQTRTVNFSLKSTGSTISGTSSGSLTITIPALPTYTVKYNANGGSGAPSSQTKTYGKTLTLRSTEPTRTGYTFDHWDTASDGSGSNYRPGGSYTKNAAVTLYARWSVNSYKLTYNANGGSVSPTSRTLNYGANYVLPTPTRTNYNFLGWYTAASGGTKVTTSTTMGAANTTIYAHWELDACTLTANANGGSISSTTGWTGTGTIATKTVVIGNTYGTLPTVSRTGYTSNGWFTAASGGTKVYTSTEMGSSNTTIYAQWTGPNSYQLKAKAGGGSISSTTGWTGTGATVTKTITYNNAYGTLPTVSRTGYTLQGWYTTASGGTQVTTSTKMGGANTAIYAHWNPKNYTLKAIANGGSISSTTGWTGTGVEATKIVACDSAYGTLPTASQTGYTFQGWYTAPTEGTEVFPSDTMGTANTNIYAHWQANHYTINYNPNPPAGTTASGTVGQTTHTYDVASELSTQTYTIPDYIFKGWATSPTGTVRYTSGQSVSRVTTVNNQVVQLYAIWEYSYEAPTFGETINAIRCDFEIVEEESFIPQEEGYYESISIDSNSYMPPYQLTSDTQKQSGKVYYKLQPDDLGKYALISVDIQNIGLDKIDNNNNTRYIRFYYKRHSDNSYTICDYKTITTPSMVYGLLVPGTGPINSRDELDSQTQYDIKIEANIEKTEEGNTVVKASRSITTFISVAKFLIDMDINGGDKIAFGKSASKVGFECDMDAYFNNSVTIGPYPKANSNTEPAVKIGNGTGTTTSQRSNAATIDWNGNYMGQGMAGQIIMFAGGVVQSVSDGIATTEGAPPGWLSCNGNAVSRTYYAELFAIIGTTYGSGDGSTTFNLPNFRGRVPVGVGTAEDNNSTANATATGAVQGATSHTRGEMSGEETHTLTTDETATKTHSHTYTKPPTATDGKALTTANLPAHTHGSESLTGYFTIRPYSTSGGNILGTDGIVSSSNVSSTSYNGVSGGSTGEKYQKVTINATHTHNSVGSGTTHSHDITNTSATTTGNPTNASGTAHNNMPPYSVINYLIATGKTY